MTQNETPLALVQRWPKLLPGCWALLDNCFARKEEIGWSDYCHLPINAAVTTLYSSGMSVYEAAALGSELTACYTWRKLKVIFRFDQDLAEVLTEQALQMEDTDELPMELLLRLPYNCIYIKTKALGETMDGFWAWIDYDVNRKAHELRIQYVKADYTASIPGVLHLVPNSTIRECIADTSAETKKWAPNAPELTTAGEIRHILIAIQFLLYLISDRADIKDEPRQGKSKPQGRKAKGKTAPPKKGHGIEDKASEVRGKDVGLHIGRFLRQAKSVAATPKEPSEKGHGGSKRPHSRRGHWHHYWIGPKDGKRELILRWTAPTFIHADDGSVMVYEVKE